MTIGTSLKEAAASLKEAGIATARLDALILLEDATGRDRAWLLANEDKPLSVKVSSQMKKWVTRRANHEPLAYIRGHSEFYGREFRITPATLQPRPETETMLELFAQRMADDRFDILGLVDVGTGSGAIAITAKLEFPKLNVYATEINQDALKVAKQNAKNLSADVKFYKGNLLKPLPTLHPAPSTLAVLANLPYVPDSHTINQAAMQEPALAIFGGPDGLDLYRQMFDQLSALDPQPYTLVLTESLPSQHKELLKIAKSHGYKLIQTADLVQVFTTED